MSATTISLGYWQLAFAAMLVIVNIAISIWLKLGLARNLVVGSVRMVVQLLIVGFILEFVFTLKSPLPVLGIGVVMATLAGVSAVNRTKRRFPGVYWNSLLSVFGASFVITGAGVLGIVDVQPWYEPQYTIPLLGMVLGNILNGVSLSMDRFMEGIVRERPLIEADLALGATRWEAAHQLVTDALRTGMIPTVNSMMVMGIVSLPGMMTGQLLAGAAPVAAVRYQIVIMFMIAAATALGALGVVLLAFRALFNHRHQLCFNLLHSVGS